MPAKVILTVTKGRLNQQKFEFDSRTTCIIGRATDCYPRIPNDKDHQIISRYHCFLDINPPDIRIRDLGSLHGTYVNNKIIGQRQPDQTPEEGSKMNFLEQDLKEGDSIELGNTEFRVSVEVDSQIAPKPNVRVGSNNIQNLLERANAGESNLAGIKGYIFLKKLGEGGCGEVYLVRHQQTGKLVALKTMRPTVRANSFHVKMFLREAENTKALNHPNVIQLMDCFFEDDIFFFTLEYCNGGSVNDLMKQRGGKLSVDEAVPIILQTLDGLNHAHNVEIPYVKKGGPRSGAFGERSLGKVRGLVHRDIKPANIFLSNTGDTIIAKLGDYGLAKAFDLAGLSGQTMTGTKGGTPSFMCQQQVKDFKYAKPEVDMWATAASLYNMLTGAYPRDLKGNNQLAAILATKPVPIRQRNASIPKPLADLIDLALIDEPKIHFRNALAFKQALLSVV